MISVVMAYYNRLRQLQHTLKTITASLVQDLEVVIANDFSASEHGLNDLPRQWPHLDIRVIDMRELYGQKNYCNPCVPYNVAFRASRGDKILIQNPECCHMGDVLAYVDQNLSAGQYLSFHAYGCTKEDLATLYEQGVVPMYSHAKKARWYNHEQIRPTAFHFCNAITRVDLRRVNGFDERFAQGHNWDDAEFLHRIKKICQVKFVADPWVVHQYHAKSYGHPDNPAATTDNRQLYHELAPQDLISAPNKVNLE